MYNQNKLSRISILSDLYNMVVQTWNTCGTSLAGWSRKIGSLGQPGREKWKDLLGIEILNKYRFSCHFCLNNMVYKLFIQHLCCVNNLCFKLCIGYMWILWYLGKGSGTSLLAFWGTVVLWAVEQQFLRYIKVRSLFICGSHAQIL